MEHLNEACWSGYKQVGMKEIKGRMVPNCVPVEEGEVKDTNRESKREYMKKLTPTGDVGAGRRANRRTQKPDSLKSKHSAERYVKMLHADRKAKLDSYGRNPGSRLMQVAWNRLPPNLQNIGSDVRPGDIKKAKEAGKLPLKKPDVDEGLRDIVKDLKNFGRIQAATIGKQPGETAEFIAKIKALQAKKKQEKKPAVATEGQNSPAYKGPIGYDDGCDCYPNDPDENINELYEGEYCPRCLIEVLSGQHPEQLGEAQYQGRSVSLGKPFRTSGGPKKFSVYVKNKKGNIIKVNFGDPNMKIKKNIPGRRKSFRARHKCHTAKDRTSARYWSCRAW